MYNLKALMIDAETRRETPFEMLSPAISHQAAVNAAYALGYAINDATDHRLKIKLAQATQVGESWIR